MCVFVAYAEPSGNAGKVKQMCAVQFIDQFLIGEFRQANRTFLSQVSREHGFRFVNESDLR